MPYMGIYVFYVYTCQCRRYKRGEKPDGEAVSGCSAEEPGAIYRPCRQHVRIAPEHTRARIDREHPQESRRFARIYIQY